MALERVDDTEEILVTIGGAPVESTGSAAVDDFFRDVLRPLAPCCLETLGNATENLAVLSAGLFEKAESTLDQAREAARDSTDLVDVAKAYLELAEAMA